MHLEIDTFLNAKPVHFGVIYQENECKKNNRERHKITKLCAKGREGKESGG